MINNALSVVLQYHVKKKKKKRIFLKFLNFTILDDGISFWLDSEMKKCIPCNESLPNCKHCTSGNKCLECIIPELLDEATSTCKCSAD